MKKLILSIVTLIFSFQAHAGAFIEPFLGVDSSTVTATTVGGATANSTSKGFDYGARLGYKFASPWWVGVDYTGGSGKDDGDSSSSDYNKTVLGALFGYDLGKHIIWAGYGFTDEVVYKTTPELKVKGTNIKLGYGYKATNKISLNLDLIIPNYTKASAGGNEIEISQFYSKFTVTTIMFTVSFPIGYSK